MPDYAQVALGALAVALLVIVPILCILIYDAVAGERESHFAQWRRQFAKSREHRRAVQALRRQHGVPLEQLAKDLRRLRAVVSHDEHRSAAHQLGNRLAYDKVLIQVCEMLEIEHNLDDKLAGLERDIERVRIEAELERAGVVLTEGRRFGQAA